MTDREKALETSLRRLLVEFDFMVERGVIPDTRDDMIFAQAREALQIPTGISPSQFDLDVLAKSKERVEDQAAQLGLVPRSHKSKNN